MSNNTTGYQIKEALTPRLPEECTETETLFNAEFFPIGAKSNEEYAEWRKGFVHLVDNGAVKEELAAIDRMRADGIMTVEVFMLWSHPFYAYEREAYAPVRFVYTITPAS